MGVDIYRAKYEYVFGHITEEQFNFINDIIYRSDDGTYELDYEHFQKLKQRKERYEKTYRTDLGTVFQAFESEIKKGKGHFSFRVFA
jgi:hypothetical protein